MKISVIVQCQIEGVHRWRHCNIEEVSFLRNKHRHVFHIMAVKEVRTTERDVEIIHLRRQILMSLQAEYGTPCDFGDMSCEMIAEWLLKHFNLSQCAVLEDGENGAQIETTSFLR